MSRRLLGLALLGVLAIILAGVASASAASNTVAGSGLGERRQPTAPNDLKPPACAAVPVTNKMSGIGTITGTSANDLMLGSNLVDVLDGAGGGDCVLGGAGNDTLRGSAGDDVVDGGPGDDSLNGGTGRDGCYGGGGNDSFSACETIVR